jgi:glucosamine-6-phosphate deaminase
MKIIVKGSREGVADYAAKHIQRIINDFNPGPGRLFVLGLPTGSTPLLTYKKLIEFFKQGTLSFKYVKTFNMDEYIGLPMSHPESYHSFMFTNFFKHIDIDPHNVHILNGEEKDMNGHVRDLNKECQDFENEIKKAGGIDLFMGGIGNNGHIAFNEPGSPFDSRTRIVQLTPETRKANARFFGRDMTHVPTRSLTVGVETIMDAKEVMVLATGFQKALAIKESVEGTPNTKYAASALQNHKNVVFVCDSDAAFGLSS